MVDVLVFVPEAAPFDEGRIERTARRTLEAEGVEAAELSVALLDDDAIADLNRLHLGHPRPTDVISFPLHEAGAAPIGDIYIGWEQCLRQADEEGIDPDEEVRRLVVHGVLHVLGYDHPDGEERLESVMWRRQEELLREIDAACGHAD